MNQNILVFILLSLLADSAFSQDGEKKHHPYLNLGIQVGVPRDDFQQVYPGDALFGLGGRLMFPIDQNVPFDAGFQFYYMWMGSKSEDFTLVNPKHGRYKVDSKVSGSMMPFHLNLRIRPLRNATDLIDPYFEGLAGFRIFNVRTKVQVDDLTNTEQPPAKTSNQNHASWSYGYAGGLAFRLAENIMIDLRYERLWGSSAKYLDTKNISFTSKGDPVYTRKESETNISNYELGIIFQF